MDRPRLDDETFELAGYRFGFADRVIIDRGMVTGYSVVEWGPLGGYRIPVRADSAWGLLFAAFVLFIAISLLLTRRRNRPFPAPA